MKYHLFMEITTQYDPDFSRVLRFFLYFSSLFVWACAIVLISSDTLLKSVSVEILAGIFLLGANLLYKFEAIYLNKVARFGRTTIIVINCVLTIFSIAISYY